jgi:hypothetical protein
MVLALAILGSIKKLDMLGCIFTPKIQHQLVQSIGNEGTKMRINFSLYLTKY